MPETTFPIEFIGGSRDGEVFDATAAPNHVEVPVEGGLPLVVGGKIVGAIGMSGGTSAQDGQAAAAGAAMLK